MEHTLVLIKPDGVKKGLVGKIIHRFEDLNLRLAAMKMVQLDDVILDTWYLHHKDKPFFAQLRQFMKQTPVVAIVLEGKEAVAVVRTLAGPTDSRKAAKGSIRGDFGFDVQENVIHASDSVERAKEEIKLLFSAGEVFDYPLK